MTERTKSDLVSNVRDPDRFISELKQSVEEFASGVSFEEFQDVVEVLAEKSSISKKLYETQRNHLADEICKDIDFVRQEMKLDEKYTEITRLINESEYISSGTEWRPKTGVCNSIMDAYVKKGLVEKKRRLQEMIKKENKALHHARELLETKLNERTKQLQKITDTKYKLQQLMEFYSENIEQLNSLNMLDNSDVDNT